MVEQYNIKVLQLEVTINGGEPIYNKDIDPKDLYHQLREGAMAKTNATTPGHVEDNMRESLENGKDILYLGFTSGLSVTYNNAAMVIADLKEEFPERKIMSIDTLAASAGQGMLVHYAALKREEGLGMEEIYEEVLAIRDKLHHHFTVDDLFFLKRGGRISATTAVAGSILNIKPILHVSKEGKLETVGKVRGRKVALKELVSKMKASSDIDAWDHVFISHGDSMEDAEYLKALIEKEYPTAKVTITYVGPVIGAHAGPGVIALFYLGKTEKGTI
jgi:DegV family protein with EDD domain